MQIILLVFTCFIPTCFSFQVLTKRQEICNHTFTLCYPTIDQTWYHYNHYMFRFNQNNTYFIDNRISQYDLYISTSLNSLDSRTQKSWYNLTSDLSVQITDDWFPQSLLPNQKNQTWIMYVFLLAHNTILPFNLSNLILPDYQPFVRFRVVQTSPIPIIRERLEQKWMIAIVTIASLFILSVVIIMIYLYYKKKQQRQLISKPDALLIADKFRQVLSTAELHDQRSQVGQDLLHKQLAKDQGTSISQMSDTKGTSIKY